MTHFFSLLFLEKGKHCDSCSLSPYCKLLVFNRQYGCTNTPSSEFSQPCLELFQSLLFCSALARVMITASTALPPCGRQMKGLISIN